ncbi:hypothetical protein ACI8AA_23115 [Geodermatophilus sp. SYSU D01180]
MSLVLGKFIRDFTPAGTHDQLVLIHICDEILTPDATAEVSLPSGAFLDPSHQAQNQRKVDGGGFLSMTALGSRVWPEIGDPKQWRDRAVTRTRRLRGLPNATGYAWFPALLWQVGGGSYRDNTGVIRNRHALWRVPLVREAVLVPVPKSGRKAATEPWKPEESSDLWRPATGWREAVEPVLQARMERGVRAAGDAAAAEVAAELQGRGYSVEDVEALAAKVRNRAEKEVQQRWDSAAARAAVLADLNVARAVQGEWVRSSAHVAEGDDDGFIPNAWIGGGREHADRLRVIAERAAAAVLPAVKPQVCDASASGESAVLSEAESDDCPW